MDKPKEEEEKTKKMTKLCSPQTPDDRERIKEQPPIKNKPLSISFSAATLSRVFVGSKFRDRWWSSLYFKAFCVCYIQPEESTRQKGQSRVMWSVVDAILLYEEEARQANELKCWSRVIFRKFILLFNVPLLLPPVELALKFWSIYVGEYVVALFMRFFIKWSWRGRDEIYPMILNDRVLQPAAKSP